MSNDDFSTDDLRYTCREYHIVLPEQDLGRAPDFTRHLGESECYVDLYLIEDKIARMLDAGAKWIRRTRLPDGDIWIEGWK